MSRNRFLPRPMTTVCWAFAGAATALSLSDAIAQPPQFVKAQIFFELNATDGDIGLQGLIDADSWQSARIKGPGGSFDVIRVASNAASAEFGINEVFFESNEPTLAERPFSELLAQFPAGTYQFSATTAANEVLTATAKLTADMPCPPVVLAPLVSGGDFIARWRLKAGVYNPDTGVCSTARAVKFDIARVSIELTSIATGKSRKVEIDMPPGARSVEAPDEFMAGVDFDDYEVKVSVNISEVGGNRTSSELEPEL